MGGISLLWGGGHVNILHKGWKGERDEGWEGARTKWVPVDEVDEVSGTGYGQATNSWSRSLDVIPREMGFKQGGASIIILTLQTWKPRPQEVTGLVRGSSTSQGQSLEKKPAVPDSGTSSSFSLSPPCNRARDPGKVLTDFFHP